MLLLFIDELTVYSENKPNNVYLNDEKISFNYKNGYIYFGSNPIVEKEPEEQKENIDTSTPQGKFMLTVFGALAELERDQILQR